MTVVTVCKKNLHARHQVVSKLSLTRHKKTAGRTAPARPYRAADASPVNAADVVGLQRKAKGAVKAHRKIQSPNQRDGCNTPPHQRLPECFQAECGSCCGELALISAATQKAQSARHGARPGWPLDPARRAVCAGLSFNAACGQSAHCRWPPAQTSVSRTQSARHLLPRKNNCHAWCR